MKKYYFLIFTYLFVVLLPVFSSAQTPFTITAVKSGSGLIGIPIDTIRPGVNFGLRVVGAPGISFEFTTVKLDTAIKSPYFGMWVKDSAGYIYPDKILNTDASGLFSTDSAYYRFAYNPSGTPYMCPFEDRWIKIVVKTGGAAGVGLDTSKPLLALASPIDSGRYLIVVNPNPMGATGPTEISIYSPRGGNDDFEIKIFDTFGYLVKDLLPEVQHVNQVQNMYVKWNGTNTKGKKVANGVYLICVKVMENGKEAGIWKKKIGVAW
ncbi:MAG: hypothetical protein PHX21_11700 [bacterium]|nr:hypothetical protein [bacterium]